MCIFAFFAMLVEAPYNYYMGLVALSWLCTGCMVFICFLYYLSRIKRKSQFGIMIFSLAANIVFVLCYFYDSGLNGPNVLLFTLCFFIIISIIPSKQYWFWVPFNIITVLSVIAISYRWPELAPMLYKNKIDRSIDFGVTYVVAATLIFFSIRYMRQSYDYERAAVEERNREIEAQNEEITKQKRELEFLNNEKDRLFSIVAHDVRMPLSSIQGYLEILNGVGLQEDEKQHIEEQLLQITKDTSEMLMNILSWSKTQLKGINVQLRPLDVNAVLKNWLKMEKSIAEKKGIHLNTLTAGQLHILADHDMLQLVIRNLVSNAIKFTPAGGEVVVSTRYHNDAAVIVIADNGVGISSEKQQTLFQLNASATYGTNNERGVGLGLLLCKEFTEQQNGKIWYESKPNQGSVFYVSLQLETN